VRGADRRHSLQGPADDSGPWYWLRWNENRAVREGATENAAVVNSLFSELVECGLDFSTPRLYILDGGKALHAAVRRHAGEAGFIRRCQTHKKRNVVDHLPDKYKADVRGKMQTRWRSMRMPSARSISSITS
jgi:putative transposase